MLLCWNPPLSARCCCPLAAGLSTLLGALVVFAARRRSEKLLAVSLGFAGGVMLAVSFTDLFPTAREHLTASLGGRPGRWRRCCPWPRASAAPPPWTTWFPTTPLTPTPARPHTKTCSGVGFVSGAGHGPAQLSRGRGHLPGGV